MQEVGNQGGLQTMMAGMGIIGRDFQDMIGSQMQSMGNMLSNQGQKMAAVQQQRRGYAGPMGGSPAGAGRMDPNAPFNISGDYVGIDPTGGNVTQGAGGRRAQGPGPVTGDVTPSADGPGNPRVTQGAGGGGNARVTEGSGGGSRGGGGGGRLGGGGGGNRAPRSGGSTPVGGMNFNRSSMLGGATNVAGMIAPVMMGVGNIQEGKTLEGVGNLSGGAAALAATRGMNPLIRLGAAGLGAIGVGGLGAAGDRMVAEKTGQGSDEYNQEKNRYQTNANLKPLVQTMNAIQQTAMENDILRMKAQEPILNRMLDGQLVRQQAMNASLTNSYAMLGTLSAQAKMAQQGQREAGANFRTALTANPYAASAVASPSISF